MTKKFAHAAWRRLLADETDFRSISTLEQQDASPNPASPGVAVSGVDLKISEARSPSTPVLSENEDDWTMDDLVEVDAVKGLG